MGLKIGQGDFVRRTRRRKREDQFPFYVSFLMKCVTQSRFDMRIYTNHRNSFTLERHITNWDTSYIEGQIRSLIAATGYTNHVTVTFPVRYSKITVQPRGEGFIATLFSPILEKRRYEVARAVWPYATLPPGLQSEDAGRSCAVQTEEAWWRDWKDVLKLAIVTRRHGWVTLDDILEFRMSPIEPHLPKNPWGYQ